MKVTASTNLQIGDYQALKAAHLSHDEDKYNSNADIDYSKKKYNTHNVYVDDMEAWKDEHYEEPIREYNARQKNKSRRFEDYKDYHKKQSEKGSRNKDREISPNRLMLMNFADMQSNKAIKHFLTKRIKNKVTEEQYYQIMAEGMDLAVKRFNEKYGEHLQITESFTHVNEASPHTHCDLWAKGTDKFGKPVVDINDSLYAYYGKTRTVEKKKKDGTVEKKEVRMTHKALWETFRRDVDEEIIHKSMMDTIQKRTKTNIKGIDFHRKESEVTGINHELFKEAAKQATKSERVSLGKRGKVLDERERVVEDRERDLSQKEADFEVYKDSVYEDIEKEKKRLERENKRLRDREKANDRRFKEKQEQLQKQQMDFMRQIADVARGYASEESVKVLDDFVEMGHFVEKPRVIRSVIDETVQGAIRKGKTKELQRHSRDVSIQIGQQQKDNDLELG